MFVDSHRLHLRAAAKINLFLEILGERENGYHDLRSIVMPVSLCDEVELELTDGLIDASVTYGRGLPVEDSIPAERNLALRAALALREQTGTTRGVRIRILKRIPVGGGLGGGSSDAATTLRGLNDLWELDLPLDQLAAIGSGIGCDVPALIHGGMVCMEGLGERTSRVVPEGTKLDAWWVVLVNPGFPVATRDIYNRYSPSLTSERIAYSSIVSALNEGSVSRTAACLHNDLQATVFRKFPLIEMMADQLCEAGALGALLSGSGGTVFGVARDRAHAQDICEQLLTSESCPLWAQAAQTLPDGVMVAHGPLEA